MTDLLKSGTAKKEKLSKKHDEDTKNLYLEMFDQTDEVKDQRLTKKENKILKSNITKKVESKKERKRKIKLNQYVTSVPE